ncbi:copper homeostasis protein [Lutibacter sp. Hel_I_33_5]|uniref:copper homeostasis protein CutC n=1 Tax=Lutibacter sp. Hel_I_33_5 TaxID=1566289 RepID=UPI00119F145C|nr:copper homeostasis protein CutC [Lutibacter sp. Hel_I_33_5]TVZ55410.1 copper homeostasis protein [Lutibacter sp. Hel_I_33_5]
MILEICTNSYQSALNAQNAGADRIELCSELSVGGITPSYGLLKKISEEITIPVNVLIRPRSGNFYYSDDEFELMKSNIEFCKKLGFNGIVSGILDPDNSIDIKCTKELIKLSKPLTFTFHRAFDCVKNPKESLLQLINLKVDRILTSGLQDKAEQGIELLIELKELAKDKIIILPGNGINPTNIHLFKNAGFKEVHSSASKVIRKENSNFFGNSIQTESDVKTIQEILKAIKSA